MTQRRAFGHVSSASGVGGVRLRCRAPGAGIPAGAVTGGSSAAGNSDGMPRCTTVNTMTHDSRWTSGH
jgi:hypothetical protein